MEQVMAFWNGLGNGGKELLAALVLWAVQEAYTKWRRAPGLSVNTPNNVKRLVAAVPAALSAVALAQKGDILGAIAAGFAVWGGATALAVTAGTKVPEFGKETSPPALDSTSPPTPSP